MNSWSLKVKFGFYAATLTMLALLSGVSILLPTIHFRQLSELDRLMEQNAGEFFRDLENFQGAPMNPRHPLSAKFIPLSLQNRQLILKGPEGQLLFESPGLNGRNLSELTEGFLTKEFEGRKIRVGAFQKSPFSLQIGADMKPLQELQNTILIGLAYAGSIAAMVVFIGGFLLGKYAIRPISALTKAAESISVHASDDRLPIPPSRDEVYRLSIVLNEAFERLRNAYAAATRFSADASHQLKTPIAVLRLGLEELRSRTETDEQLHSEIDSLLQQTRRLTALINDLLLLAQADAGRLQLEQETVDLEPLINSAVDDLETLTFEKEITIEKSISHPLRTNVDQRRLNLALQVLIENAAKYTPRGGKIRVLGSIENGVLTLDIGNTGKRLTEQDTKEIFERFRRGSGVGENVSGHGLGLNIAKTLLTAHGGDLCLIESDADWVEFRLTLPVNS
jgi:signal transduction histidine kinase